MAESLITRYRDKNFKDKEGRHIYFLDIRATVEDFLGFTIGLKADYHIFDNGKFEQHIDEPVSEGWLLTLKPYET